MLIFPVPGGIVTLQSSKLIPLECTMVSGQEVQPSASTQVVEEIIKVAIHPEYPEQTIAIGSTLIEDGRKELCGLLRRNPDIFAEKSADMTGVLRHVAEHQLNVHEGRPRVRQKKRSQAAERNKATQKEVERLVEAGIMKEVHYHNWLSNLLMIKKHDDSWRMCVDFKDLNKACPKDGYPLPEIDWKNAGATYQRLVDKAFQKQIGRNLEVEEDSLFLGYMVNTIGIKVCLDKVEAVLSLPSSKCLKDVQRLKGKLASLNRFLTKSAEKSLPFFKTLKKCTKKSDFQWTTEVKAAFKQMKNLIAELLTLTAPMEKEELIVYLAAAREAVSAVLITEREAKQMPIYFVSRAVQGPEINYTPVEKLGIELGEYDIHYRPTVSIKGQILAYFIVKRPEDDSLAAPMKVEEELPDSWTLFTDRSSCIDAEYEALLSSLRIAEKMGIKNLQTYVDSCLAANQVNGSYIAKEPVLKEKSISEAEVLAVVEEEGNTWMTLIYEYLTEKTLPAKKKKARSVRLKLRRYAVINGVPYKNLSLNHGYDVSDRYKQTMSLEKSIKDPAVCTLGQVERANRSLGEGMKARLDKGSKDWMEEIPHVLWAHRTMIKSSNGDTPFSLTYETEVVIPTEIGMPTLRTTEIDMVQNDEALRLNLDLLEEKREQAAIREARSKAKMEKYYNSKVHNISFKPGDLVNRSNDASHAEDGGKLGPKWEGPYEVIEALGKGAYKLRDRNGKLIPRTWNSIEDEEVSLVDGVLEGALGALGDDS
ncbi:reverse transcriptase domain-containing protein [Tanacetum coccineum]